jgi:BioD-like phosphotransacetylase family protein
MNLSDGIDVIEIIAMVASLITGLGVILAATKKGRDWIVKPISDKLETITKNFAEEDIRLKEFVTTEVTRLESSIQESLTDTLEIVHTNRKSLLRIEILENIHNTPEKIEVIERLYTEYKDNSGNGYLDAVYVAWKNKYETQVVIDRI